MSTAAADPNDPDMPSMTDDQRACLCNPDYAQACSWCCPRGIPLDIYRRGLSEASRPNAQPLPPMPKWGEGVKKPRVLTEKVGKMLHDIARTATAEYTTAIEQPKLVETEPVAYLKETAQDRADVAAGGLPIEPSGLGSYEDSHVRTIRGDEYEAYEEFRSAARALRAAGEAQRLALERYKAALERHSEMACKVDQ